MYDKEPEKRKQILTDVKHQKGTVEASETHIVIVRKYQCKM